ncbi:MAG TPA: lysylphosphatidylglycerol synthase transmembrane domain-containing protein [Candidatus Udaeobacter sp.]|jgi:uncharacterized membrane protein YbhN (UPF0104 family)|nr:lysylphosphatidylglycerol synthase transmembrane domain-containing protein [Candidatus Udaeobacter sp.]
MRSWPTRITALLGLLLGLVFLALAVARLDLPQVGRSLAAARLWPWLPLAVTCYIAGHFLRGRRLRWLVSPEASLTTTTATNVVVVGYAVNNLLPVRLGEIARAWMLTERSGLSIIQSFTVTVLERVLDGLVLLALFGLTLLVLPQRVESATPFLVAAIVLALAGGFVLVTVLAPGLLVTTLSRVTQRVWPRAHDAVVGQAGAVVNGVAYLRNPFGVLRVSALGALVWICEAGMYWSLLPAFAIPARPTTALLAMTTTNLGILVPSTPGYIGPFHFFCMQAVRSTGVASSVAFSYAVLVHLAFYVPITIWGLAVILTQGLSVGRTLALSRMAQPIPSLPRALAGLGTRISTARRIDRPQAPSRFMMALSEAAIPVEADGLSEPDRTEVIHQVAEFVTGQLAELPFRLRFLFMVGMSGFRLATRGILWRDFCSLESARRRAWLERWAYGRFGPARQLFRGVRSTALLSYYEHPAVRRALDARGRAR